MFENTSGKNDAVLHHLLVEHQLVIADVDQVCDFKRYVITISSLSSTTPTVKAT